MSEHKATVTWKNTSQEFLRGKFSRAHSWSFDGGLTIPASASPSVVPAPWSDPAGVDPEEAFVASLSSCHMLTFVFLASRKGFTVESYEDHAVGHMAKNAEGLFWIETVLLRPAITYAGEKRPTPEEEASLHHDAHRHCFVANSVKTEVKVEHA